MSLEDFGASGALDCPICCEILQNAFHTACGHCFCEHCLFLCLEREHGTCPVCRKNPSPINPNYTVRLCVEEFRKLSFLTREQISGRPASEYKELGNECYKGKKFAEALKHYGRAIEMQPTAALFGNRAICYAKLHQNRLAIEDCDKALRLDSKYVKVMVRKAICLEQENEHRAAVEAFKQAKQMDKEGTFSGEIDGGLSRLDSGSTHSKSPPQNAQPQNSTNVFERMFGSPPNQQHHGRNRGSLFDSFFQGGEN